MSRIDFVVLVCCSTNVIIYSCVNSEPPRCVVYVRVVAGHRVSEERLQIESWRPNLAGIGWTISVCQSEAATF